MRDWCPFAVRVDGPRNSFGYDGVGDYSPKRGAILHDSTGPLQPTLNVVLAEGSPSWHFTIDDETGLIYQHYEVSANCWHANDTDIDGNVRGNIDFVGIEHTRPNAAIASKLSDAGIRAAVRLNRWLLEEAGFPFAVRYPDQVGAWALAEHKQIGNTATACPSNRIPWGEIMWRLGEDDVEQAEKERRIALIVAMLKRPDVKLVDRDPDPVTGEPIVEVLTGVATDEQLRIRIR